MKMGHLYHIQALNENRKQKLTFRTTKVYLSEKNMETHLPNLVYSHNFSIKSQ